MKPINLKSICLALAAGVTLLGHVNKSVAGPLDDTVSYTNNFDNSSSTASWIYWYGVNPGNSAMVWDSTMDADNNPNSGSLLYEATIPQYNQQAWFGTFNNNYGYDLGGTHDPTKYTNLAVYVHVDGSSTALDNNGDYGQLQFGFYNATDIGSQIIPASASNGWVRLVQPIDPAVAGAWGPVGGICFRYQTYYTDGNVSGHMKMWMDKLTFNVSPVKVLPPKLLPPANPSPGLNLFSSALNGNQYQRTSIQLQTHSGLSWIGQQNVTYSFNITQFPGAAYAGYQAHLFILPTVPISQYETSPDYNETNLLWLNVQNNGDGSATAYLRYKINEPNSNANEFGAEVTGAPGTPWAGQIAALSAASPIGTWSLTFNNNTNVTISGPGGVSTNVNLHVEVAALFGDPLDFILGAQPNNTGSVGQDVVFGAASITNGGTATTVLYDNFLTDSSLNTSTWSLLTGDPATVQIFGSDPGQQLLKWNLPDTGFSLQVSTNLANAGAWKDLSGLTTFVSSGQRSTLVPSANLARNVAYFRLIQRTYSQLQVLFPGETNAPNTVSGKVGSPFTVNSGDTVSLTVNAVDNTFHVIPGIIDNIHITSTDGSAIVQNDAALVNGTGTYLIQLNTSGAQTVSATDTTNTNIPTAVSTSVNVN